MENIEAEIVRRILGNLNDRSGFVVQADDEPTQEEVIKDLQDLVKDSLERRGLYR